MSQKPIQPSQLDNIPSTKITGGTHVQLLDSTFQYFSQTQGQDTVGDKRINPNGTFEKCITGNIALGAGTWVALSTPSSLTDNQGSWNASTNTPTITSGVGTPGHWYTVSVAGTTSIDGISGWGVGDYIWFDSTTSTWQQINNQVSVSSSVLWSASYSIAQNATRAISGANVVLEAAEEITAAYDSFTKLILHAEGDSSNTPKTVVFNGNAGFSTAQKKIGNTSLLLDGTGDYVTSAANADYAFGTGNFTVEAYVYFTASGTYKTIVSTRTTSSADATAWGLTISNSSTLVWFSDVAVITSSALTASTWYHVAVVRNGTTLTMYVNGASVGTATDSRNYTKNVLSIGANNDGTEAYISHIDEVRLSKGVARWTSTFTPPTTAYTSDANTSFLLHCDGDESASAKSFTTGAGTPQLSVTQKKFGNQALYFDGVDDAILIPTSSADFNFGTGDFTVDFWYYKAGAPQANARLFQTAAGDTVAGLSFVHSSANILNLYSSSNGSTFDIANPSANISVSDATWTHFAIVRSGNTFSIYKDGTLATSFTSSASLYYNAAHSIVVGGNGSGVSRSINGYIDELRISKGIARWTANFTPPTSAYAPAAPGWTTLIPGVDWKVDETVSRASYNTVGRTVKRLKVGTANMAFAYL